MERIIVLRGAGEMATGVAHRLFNCGYKILLTDVANPLSVRGLVSFSECIRLGRTTVENVTAVMIPDNETTLETGGEGLITETALLTMKQLIEKAWSEQTIPVIVDPTLAKTQALFPGMYDIVIDATISKKNLARTHRGLAPLVVGMGPGFTAPENCDVVVETNRGHEEGKIILKGSASADTGIPGIIKGEGERRVLRSPKTGIFQRIKDIGDDVAVDEVVATVEGAEVKSKLNGFIRGLLNDGVMIREGVKVGDVDPRSKQEVNCHLISDKARCLSGSILEIVVRFRRGLLPIDKIKSGDEL